MIVSWKWRVGSGGPLPGLHTPYTPVRIYRQSPAVRLTVAGWKILTYRPTLAFSSFSTALSQHNDVNSLHTQPLHVVTHYKLMGHSHNNQSTATATLSQSASRLTSSTISLSSCNDTVLCLSRAQLRVRPPALWSQPVYKIILYHKTAQPLSMDQRGCKR